MKIAVTFENEQIFQHFGHTEQFAIYTVENSAVKDRQIVSTNGSGHGALAAFLRSLGADTLICGGIGGGALQALAAAGIRVYGGAAGSADAAVQALLAGAPVGDANVHCDHHDHDHGEHSCGTCGSDCAHR